MGAGLGASLGTTLGTTLGTALGAALEVVLEVSLLEVTGLPRILALANELGSTDDDLEACFEDELALDGIPSFARILDFPPEFDLDIELDLGSTGVLKRTFALVVVAIFGIFGGTSIARGGGPEILRLRGSTTLGSRDTYFDGVEMTSEAFALLTAVGGSRRSRLGTG